LLAVAPVVSLYARNVHETPPRQLVGPVLIALGASSLLWLLLRAVLRDGQKAGLITSLVVVYFYTVARLNETWDNLLQNHWVQRPEIYRVSPALFAGLEAALLLAAAWWVLSRLPRPGPWTKCLNVFAAVLVALPAGEAAWARASGPLGPSRGAPPLARGITSEARPDIYYIILDAYARSDVMKELFGFDNTPFLRHLEARGFYLARQSAANYCQTPLCLSSSLNGVYLDDLVRGLGNDQTQLAGLIGDNAVVRTLRPLGYKFVTFSTGFDPTEQPKADVYLSPYRPFNGFHRLLIDQTPLWALLPDPEERDQFSMARGRILYLLDRLPEVARDPAPTFTFAHILAPHPPFIFGEHGEDVSKRESGYYLGNSEKFQQVNGTVGSDYAERYRAQAVFITRRIEQVIDRILENSTEPPVIILQADHGSGLRLAMQSLEKTDLHERMSILNAYYFPGGRYEALYDGITPVNSFRAVFNTSFGTRLPFLPDRSYFSTWGNPYRFFDVTDRVSTSAGGPGASRRPDTPG
jgi:hypothetical protein